MVVRAGLTVILLCIGVLLCLGVRFLFLCLLCVRVVSACLPLSSTRPLTWHLRYEWELAGMCGNLRTAWFRFFHCAFPTVSEAPWLCVSCPHI